MASRKKEKHEHGEQSEHDHGSTSSVEKQSLTLQTVLRDTCFASAKITSLAFSAIMYTGVTMKNPGI